MLPVRRSLLQVLRLGERRVTLLRPSPASAPSTCRHRRIVNDT